ncbi:MAG: YdeI/OmpD-associated family protein [Acidobacteria bacterium]|nr:YdeI/OmpD-associated family protein [Acidobacteriota bacterium]
MKTLDVRTRAAWRAWLAKHHATASEVWLVFHKAHTGKTSIPYDDAVEEALCFGWVDSLIKRLDEHRYAKLKAAGLLTAAGLARRPTGRPDRPLPSMSVAAADVEKALKANPKAWSHFQALAPSHRRRYLLWIGSAKQEETRQRRLREAVRLLIKGKELGLR